MIPAVPETMLLRDAAEAYSRAGLRVFPVQPKAKIPVSAWRGVAPGGDLGGWAANGRRNIGLACGHEARVVVLDVDGEEGARSLAALEHEHEALPPTRVQRTGGGGRHYLFRCPEELSLEQIKNTANVIGAGLDVRAEGGYIVLAPSEHESGARYAWENDLELAPLPVWLHRRMTRTRPPKEGTKASVPTGPQASMSESRAAKWAAKALAEEADRLSAIGAGERNAAANRAAFRLGGLVESGLLPPEAVARALYAACQTNGLIAEDGAKAVCATLESGFKAGRAKPWTPTLEERPRPTGGGAPSSSPPSSSPPTSSSPWWDQLERTQQGTPKRTLTNIMLVLEHDPRWRGVPRFNERLGAMEFATEPPSGAGSRVPGSPVEDSDDVHLSLWLQREYQFEPSPAMCGQVLDAIARRDRFDAVKERLEGLRWDGSERIGSWLSTYLGAEDTAYTRSVGRAWLVSAVARVMSPGCKADHALVLEGPQGAGKSSALAALAMEPRWFTDSMPALEGKDAAEQLQGPWIVELGELDSMNRSEAETVKAFLSRAEDLYRPAYARRAVRRPRRCVFAGTTNDSAYLRDDTGARRFWPVKCGSIALEALRGAVEQLWAEAVDAYRSGAKWWLTPEEEALARVEQRSRGSVDAWEDTIGNYLEGRGEVTMRELCETALDLEERNVDERTKKRLVGILRRARWTTTGNPVMRGGKRVRVWTAPRDEAPAATTTSSSPNPPRSSASSEEVSSPASSRQQRPGLPLDPLDEWGAPEPPTQTLVGLRAVRGTG